MLMRQNTGILCVSKGLSDFEKRLISRKLEAAKEDLDDWAYFRSKDMLNC